MVIFACFTRLGRAVVLAACNGFIRFPGRVDEVSCIAEFCSVSLIMVWRKGGNISVLAVDVPSACGGDSFGFFTFNHLKRKSIQFYKSFISQKLFYSLVYGHADVFVLIVCENIRVEFRVEFQKTLFLKSVIGLGISQLKQNSFLYR